MTCALMLLALCAAPVVAFGSAGWIGWLARHQPNAEPLAKFIAASVWTIVVLIYALGICLYHLLA